MVHQILTPIIISFFVQQEMTEKFSGANFWFQKLVFLAHGALTYKQCSQIRPCPSKFLEVCILFEVHLKYIC